MSLPKTSTNSHVKILIAQGSPAQGERLKQALEQRGHTVTLAANGKEALDAARARKPTLIVSDITTPDMDGYALCKRLKTDKDLKDVPVILMTSLSGTEDVVKGLECGADMFVRKPYDEAAFLSRIDYALSNRELRERAKMDLPLQIKLGGHIHQINSEPRQILDLLISTYEDATRINAALGEKQMDLKRLATELEREVEKRTAALRAEIGEHTRAAKQLQQSEEQFRVITESISDLIAVLDPEGKRLYNSPSYQEVLGDPTALAGSDSFNEIHPDDRERIRKIFQETVRTGHGQRAEYRFLLNDGSIRYIESQGNVIPDEAGKTAKVVVVSRDVTERKRAEEALRESEEKYRSLVSNIPEVSWTLDAKRRFVFISGNIERVSGFSPDEVYERGTQIYLSSLHPEDVHKVTEGFRALFAEGRPFDVEVRVKRKDGEWIWVHHRALATYEKNGIRYADGLLSDITARKRAEEALRESERKYRELVQHANSIILRWTPDGRILFLNEFGQRFFGYTEAEICGRHVMGTLVPETESSGRNLLPLMDEICANPAAFEQVVNENIRRNGERVWIAWTNKVVPDEQGHAYEILSIGTDITARKQAEEELRRSESKYRTLVETSQDVIWSVDKECRIAFISPAARGVYGYEPEELLGRHLLDLVPPEWLERELQEIKKVMVKGSSKGYEHIFLRKDGTPVYLSCNSVALRDDHGHVIGAMGVSTDITERKRAEEELRAIQANLERRVIERTAELAVARDRAEMADRTKSAFLATMSHELRTPLNSIIGFTGLLLQGLAGPLNAEQAKQLGMVKESGQHLLALINDVLDISKIEAGQIEIANAPFDLPESIQKVVHTVKPLANKKQLPLIAQIAADLGQITSDRRRVEQILLNLLSNAIKFTERGEVTLTVEVTPGTRHIPRPAVRISVADTGIGIGRENLDKLFHPFRQLDTGLTRQHEGTGLGLAICKRLVERLGGTITVESEWGKGSTFQCVLPIHPERKS